MTAVGCATLVLLHAPFQFFSPAKAWRKPAPMERRCVPYFLAFLLFAHLSGLTRRGVPLLFHHFL